MEDVSVSAPVSSAHAPSSNTAHHHSHASNFEAIASEEGGAINAAIEQEDTLDITLSALVSQESTSNIAAAPATAATEVFIVYLLFREGKSISACHLEKDHGWNILHSTDSTQIQKNERISINPSVGGV